MNVKPTTGASGRIFYDGACSFCIGLAHRFERVLSKHGFALATLQSRASIPPASLTEMRLQLADGCELGGADALVEIARRTWWTWPLFALAQIPGVLPLLRVAYRQFAANRHCISGACALPHNAFSHHRHAAFFELP